MMRTMVEMVPFLVIVVFGLFSSSCFGRRLPLLGDDQKHQGYLSRQDYQKDHEIEKRDAHGWGYVNYHQPNFHNANDRRYLGHQHTAGLHSYLPFPPPHQGPHPGDYSTTFGQHQGFPGYHRDEPWNDHHEQKPCFGFGCPPKHNHGYQPDFGQLHGHVHGPECQYLPGHILGHNNINHGHGKNEDYDTGLYNTKPTLIDQEVTKPTTPTTIPPTGETTEPTYDIDVRLGDSNAKKN